MITTEQALTLARDIVRSWDWVNEIEQPEPNRLDVYLTRVEDLVPMVTALRVKRLGYLAAVTGLDMGVEADRFEVLYHFCAAAAVITLRLRLGRGDTAVPTLTEIIPGAEPYERELSEMFGITVTGLSAPSHLYLPDDWPAATYPLRKDFDARVLTGGNGAQSGE